MRAIEAPFLEETRRGCCITPRLLRPGRGEPIAQHVTMRLADSRVIAPTPAARRIAAATLLECGAADGLLAFGVVDTHAHALVACSRARAGQFARRAEILLHARLRLSCPFDPARLRPILDQWHLQRAVTYVLTQDQRHGVALDPAHDGSSLHEVLGWRVVDTHLAKTLRALVPRLSVPPPVDGGTLAGVEVRPELLAEAAAAALALPDLRGRFPLRCAARRAAAWVGVVERLHASDLADALEVTRRRVEQILVEPSPPADLLRATRIQLRFRSALSMAGGNQPPRNPPKIV